MRKKRKAEGKTTAEAERKKTMGGNVAEMLESLNPVPVASDYLEPFENGVSTVVDSCGGFQEHSPPSGTPCFEKVPSWTSLC